jgi:DNA adenine methylase
MMHGRVWLLCTNEYISIEAVFVQKTLPFSDASIPAIAPFRAQLLKWIGNKQRFAHEIAAYFPRNMQTYFEPFIGSGAVLATLAPKQAVAADIFKPLIEIWQTLRDNPTQLQSWYETRWKTMAQTSKQEAYERVKAQYNASPNGADLLFLCRACYGGVVRFRKADGFMSTPCGPQQPISPLSFNKRVVEWHERCRHTKFMQADFSETMRLAKRKDLIYCDPPYVDSQTILYGAQAFSLKRLFTEIEACKRRGVYVALSIDGSKRSGDKICNVPIPPKLFETEVMVNCGRSMLRRFQMSGQSLESEVVADRLLLTYLPG